MTGSLDNAQQPRSCSSHSGLQQPNVRVNPKNMRETWMLASYRANILNQKQARAGIRKNESDTKYKALGVEPQ
jgi:hypothetical protein